MRPICYPLTDTTARRILRGDASMALHALRGMPAEAYAHCLRIEQAAKRPRKKMCRVLAEKIQLLTTL